MARYSFTPLRSAARLCMLVAATCAGVARAEPASVTIVGDLDSEIGCPSDWAPACAAAHLAYDPDDRVWTGNFAVPAGSYRYGAALNDSWDVAYGAHGHPLSDGEIPLALPDAATVRFYYDDAVRWVADSRGTRIVTAPGSFQSELACPADWQPDCLRSWLYDIDGDGVYERAFPGLPIGDYEWKAAVDETWDENYGIGGVAGGANLAFSIVHADDVAILRFTSATNTPSTRVVPDRLFRNGFD